ncbi:TIGR03621 family F420-dependent LLM class oxidoreductase [Amycolatopsis magusensis]|uniref:TIGR03621 family F420-dependent LLM class oxidoreductase n=1 Tax=Amycolatopsis magusensis TaxID=882444 RepID=UPI0024A85E77|nr:TIGR03621 family F420-dependent LLM class oxidoreductase [Amycolatopsis magusensis]MDI5981451.1 TIGR03621 family F420-dependent LLM class oxidoreductase [Amycolatopsis magusensis]
MRFGVTLRSIGTAPEWTAKCRAAEQLGYDVITVPDHIGGTAPAPFPAIAAAAAVTERIKVGTLVLNVPFHNPALLARDVAATVQLTGGRFELGLGAGHMKAEFDDAGLPWQDLPTRLEYLTTTITDVRRRLEAVDVEMPPLLIAGHSKGVLRIAAEHAQIVGFAGLKPKPGAEPGIWRLATEAELAERVAFYAGLNRGTESNMLIQGVVVTDDKRAAATEWAGLAESTVDAILAAPQLLIGTEHQIIDRVHELRDRFGFTYFTVFEPVMERFAPILKALRQSRT